MHSFPFKDIFFSGTVLGEIAHALVRLTSGLKAIGFQLPGLLDPKLTNLQKHFLKLVLDAFSLLLSSFFPLCSFKMAQFVHRTVSVSWQGNRRRD